MKKTIALTTCAALLAGCSNIGTVNGVPVGENAQASTQGSQTYCQANPAICIVGGAVGIGILKHLIDRANDGTSNDEVDPSVDDDGTTIA